MVPWPPISRWQIGCQVLSRHAVNHSQRLAKSSNPTPAAAATIPEALGRECYQVTTTTTYLPHHTWPVILFFSKESSEGWKEKKETIACVSMTERRRRRKRARHYCRLALLSASGSSPIINATAKYIAMTCWPSDWDPDHWPDSANLSRLRHYYN